MSIVPNGWLPLDSHPVSSHHQVLPPVSGTADIFKWTEPPHISSHDSVVDPPSLSTLLATHDLFTTSTSVQVSRRAPGPSFYSPHRKFIVQTIATVASSASLVATLVTFYWFILMRKRFRHKLIILLIFGSLLRSLWFLIFATATFSRGKIPTESPLCQASGFLVAYGTEMNDFAALFIALHSTLQVFRPQVSSATSDGLYNYRYAIYAFVIVVPLIMASLAFVSSSYPYIAQGSFCTLPLRPIWYRLALAWIPRYIIWAVIMISAIAIYLHVGIQFRGLPSLGASSTGTLDITVPESDVPGVLEDIEAASVEVEVKLMPASEPGDTTISVAKFASDEPQALPASSTLDHESAKERHRELSLANFSFGGRTRVNDSEEISPKTTLKVVVPDHSSAMTGPMDEPLSPTTADPIQFPTEAVNEQRRPSAVSFKLENDIITPSPANITAPKKRRLTPLQGLTRISSHPEEHKDSPSHRSDSYFGHLESSIPLPASSFPPTPISASRRASASASTQFNSRSTTSSSQNPPGRKKRGRRLAVTPEQRMAILRQRIRRQLRMMFIYPFVYILMWFIPFILHCLQYNDRYAQHPPYALSVVSIFCLASMGLVDCIVFGLREKPWKQIRSGDGTFWGSFRRRSTIFGSHTQGSSRVPLNGERHSHSFLSRARTGSTSFPSISPISPLVQHHLPHADGWKRYLAFWRPLTSWKHFPARSKSDIQRAEADLAWDRLAREQQDRLELAQARHMAQKEANSDKTEGSRSGSRNLGRMSVDWWGRSGSIWRG